MKNYTESDRGILFSLKCQFIRLNAQLPLISYQVLHFQGGELCE